MLWFSNRDGLKSVAQADRPSAMSTECSSRRRPGPLQAHEGGIRAGEGGEEKKDKDKPKVDADKDKKEPAKDAKVEDLVIDLDGLEIRKARLTIHSSLLSDAS